MRAPIIDQGGIVRAPQGQIRLEASERLTLRPGSLTSASLEGLTVPFGYLNSAGLFGGYHRAGYVPTKSVKLAGADIDVQDGAVVDVAGGGDLLGWSFVGGIGGTVNILADTSVERYAILPSLGAAPAPISNNASAPLDGSSPLQDSRLKVGDTVYPNNVPGLAAGYYTLLPAHYALLDGGMLIEPLGGSLAAATKTVKLPDGSVIASGYRAVAGSGIRDAGYGQFKVMNNATWKQYSQFNTLSLNKSARELAQAAGLSTVRTVHDAGTIILAASNSLHLDGTGRLGAGAGGILGNLDVSAEKIALVSGTATVPTGVLRLDAQQLEAFGAGSVLIGGTRSYGATGTTVNVGASEVTVYENAQFNAPEIILAASGLVDVRGGASLTAEGSATVDTNPLLMSGNGALLRLSTGSRVGIVRSDSNGAAGTLSVADGTALRSAGSISFDGSNAINLSARAIIEAAQLDLASVVVNLGDVPAGTTGTTFTLPEG